MSMSTRNPGTPQKKGRVTAMQVAVEYIKWLTEERAKINRAELDDITFFENGVKLYIPKEIVAAFALTGMNNVDFITSGFYKGDNT